MILSEFPRLQKSVTLAPYTTFKIGGPAEFFVDVQTLDELITLRQAVREKPMPVFFIGAGSNLLVSDKGIRGLVIHLSGEFKTIAFDGEKVRIGAGAMMPMLSKQAADRGLSGVEALIGVPGTVGGGLVMNAGTKDGWIGDVTQSVEALDDSGKIQTLTKNDFGFAYRTSALTDYWLVAANLLLKSTNAVTVRTKIDTIMQYRMRTQPLTTANCGSVFKNPEGGHAADYIERAGLKGTAVGGARISEKHANFIINEKKASATDVWTLIEMAQSRVREKFKVELEPEVKRVGDW